MLFYFPGNFQEKAAGKYPELFLNPAFKAF